MRIKPLQTLKNTAKSTFNISGWFGTKQVKDTNRTLVSLIKPVFGKEAEHEDESFEDAVARFGLNDKDLKQKQRGLTQYLIVYALGAVALMIYFLYLLFSAHFFVALLVLGVLGLLGCKAYQAHYYYYQIKHRVVGTTFKEWFQGTVRGK